MGNCQYCGIDDEKVVEEAGDFFHPHASKCLRAVRDENARLQAVVDELLGVADDMRIYTHDWDWKYGEYWDGVLEKAREAAKAAKEEEGDA